MKLKIYPSIEVKIGELVANNFNPKKGLEDPATKRQFEDLKRSLANRGYMQQIIVRENEKGIFEIVDGYHRYLALKELGVKEIPATNLGAITRQEAMKELLNIEKIKVPIDSLLEAEMLRDMSQNATAEELSMDIPITAEEIENQLKLLEFDFDKLDEGKEPNPPTPRFVVDCSEQTLDDIKGVWGMIISRNDAISQDTLLLTALSKFLDEK